MTHVSIRCLTDGAIVCGKKLRAGQEVELDVADDQIDHLRVVAAAGDIAVTGLPDIDTSALKSRIALADLVGPRDDDK